MRLQVQNDRIVLHRGLFREEREIAAAAIGRILLREVHQTAALPGSGGGVPTYKVLFIDRNGWLVQRISGWGWSLDDLQRLGQMIAVPVDSSWKPVAAGVLRQEVPGSVGWFEALSTWGKVVLLGGVAIAGVVVAKMVTG